MTFIKKKKKRKLKIYLQHCCRVAELKSSEDVVPVHCLEHELMSYCSRKVLWATRITTASMLSCSSLSSSPRSSCTMVHNPIVTYVLVQPAALVPIPCSQTAPCSSTSNSPSSPCACTATSSFSHAVSTQQALLFPSCLFVAANKVLLPNWAIHRRSGNHSIAEGLRSLPRCERDLNHRHNQAERGRPRPWRESSRTRTSFHNYCRSASSGREKRNIFKCTAHSCFLLLCLAKALSYHLTVYRPVHSLEKHRVSSEREYVVLHVFKHVVSAKGITIGLEANFETWRAIFKRFFCLKVRWKRNVSAQFWKSCTTLRYLKRWKQAKNAPNSNAFKLKTGLARDFSFVSSASRFCELNNVALIFKICFENKVMSKLTNFLVQNGE